MKNMRKQFVKLLSIHGVSGDEGNVRKYLVPCLTHTMDKVEIDAYGNLLAEKRYGSGEGATVLLSAHMDTVKGVLADRALIEKDGIIMSDKGVLGADDRAGIAIILEVIRNLNLHSPFNGTLKVAFSREEEIGCVGSSRIDPKWYGDVDLAIVVDRRGNRDIVAGCMGAFCSNAVGEFMEGVADLIDQSDWKCVEGGISDALTFSEAGINAINLSAGYENEHTANEFVCLDAMKDTATLILQAFAVINDFYKNFGSVPAGNRWVKSLYTGKEASYSAWDDSLFRDDSYYSSVSHYLDADDVSPDQSTEIYHIGGGDVMLRQDGNEIYLSEETIYWLLNSLSKTEGSGKL